MFDTNWSDLLKASGIQFGFLAIATALALWADAAGILPFALDTTFRQIVLLAGFAFAALSLAAVFESIRTAAKAPLKAIANKRAMKRHAQAFADYIPHMTHKEQHVFAQLLAQNRKGFEAPSDGGYAVHLIGRGFIRMNLARNQSFTYEDVPYIVPEHIWKVAVLHKADFKPKPKDDQGDAWRVPWMVR